MKRLNLNKDKKVSEEKIVNKTYKRYKNLYFDVNSDEDLIKALFKQYILGNRVRIDYIDGSSFTGVMQISEVDSKKQLVIKYSLRVERENPIKFSAITKVTTANAPREVVYEV